MRLQVSEHLFVRPDDNFLSDLGSVPECLQLVISKDLHNPSFLIHDYACIHKGLWFSSTLDGVYVFSGIKSERAAQILGIGLYAAGYQKRAHIASMFVKQFGPQWQIEEEPSGIEIKDVK